MIKFEVPASPALKAIFPGARTNKFMLGSQEEFFNAVDALPANNTFRKKDNSAWAGNTTFAETLRKSRHGDMEAVTRSEKLLAKFEDFEAATARHVIVDDVTGAVPNVPAMLANQPLSMRRKAKREHESAPLAVIVDLGSSGSINATEVHNRGFAILALVRILSARRPVELWVGNSSAASDANDTANTYFKIETQPLDLARAAHIISHPSISRMFLYGMAMEHFGTAEGIPFAFHNPTLSTKHFAKFVRAGFPDMSEVLAIPSLAAKHKLRSDPVAWVKDKAKQYGDFADGEIEDEIEE